MAADQDRLLLMQLLDVICYLTNKIHKKHINKSHGSICVCVSFKSRCSSIASTGVSAD